MSVTDKERKKYIRQVKKYLLCSYKEKKRIISDINSIIDDFLSNNSQADITQLEKEIGTPQEIAEGFMENLSLIFFRRSSISPVIFGSSALVASSHNRTFGSAANALAIATRCF